MNNPYGTNGGNDGKHGGNNSGNNSGGGGKTVPLVIGGLILTLALVLGGFYFLNNNDSEDDNPEAQGTSSETSEVASSTEETTSTTSAASSTTSSSTGGYASPDNSLDSALNGKLPVDISNLVYDCKDATFTLQYEDDRADREMTGAQCKGAKDTPWKYSSIDIVDDAEYAENAVLRVQKGGNSKIVEDQDNNFAAMEGDPTLDTLVIANPEKDVVLELEYVVGGEGTMKEILKELGYDA